MSNKAEEKVSRFYNTVGWETDGEATEDARRWEDLREHAREYVSDCRMRVMRHIPQAGEYLLDMASGPIQYPEYQGYSMNFQKRYCIDLSAAALAHAKQRIGSHGVFMHGSFFDIPLEENFFDCSVSLHTIYHMDKDQQETAVRKLLFVTRPGKPVIIVYSNPHTLLTRLKYFLYLQWLRPKSKTSESDGADLYFHPHPLGWWARFEDLAEVRILPWRSFSADAQKKLFPDNWLGKKMFQLLFKLEDRYPGFFASHFQYPMIVLTKRSS